MTDPLSTESTWQLPIYQVLGEKNRVHWDYRTEEREEMDGTTTTFWICWECVCYISDTREQMLERLQAHPHIGDEAQQLVDGWFDAL